MPLAKRSQRGGLGALNPQKKAVPLVHHDKKTTRGGTKRPSDETADGVAKRRAAFGDITNAFAQQLQGKEKAKKVTKIEKVTKVLPRRRSGRLASKPGKLAKPVLPGDDSTEPESSSSQGSVSSVDSLPSSQSSVSSNCSDSCASDSSRPESPVLSVQDLNEKNRQKTEEAIAAEGKPQGIPSSPPLYDYDQENIKDPSLVPHYAQDIFQYMKNREEKYLLPQYLKIHNAHLEPYMRAILVDWLVEVQENFELNHETLYQAVKIVDHYLAKTRVTKERLQLVGATALFMSCKFDERCPPLIDDFVFICDDAYRREDIILMEQNILVKLDFFLNFPISYRFLRRYAKCSKVDMGTLTLARFALELALQEYECVTYRESKLAAAALLLAFKMKKLGDWSKLAAAALLLAFKMKKLGDWSKLAAAALLLAFKMKKLGDRSKLAAAALLLAFKMKRLESKLAAAALLLAFKMKKLGDWVQVQTPTLEYYSGYKEDDLKDVVRHLNSIVAAPRDSRLKTVRAKYSHSVFYEVAKLPPLDMIEEME
ncbi:G2/mitotic-specific cyclin-B3 [Branchiostoma belcheri]|nr:G2/mitotic-specific cyclin-B3 [Branchiostoma belcheri]